MKFETQAIHAGFNDDPTTNAVAVPIYQTMSLEIYYSQRLTSYICIVLSVHFRGVTANMRLCMA